MANAAIAFVNVADLATTVITASSSLLFMPVSELLVPHPGRKWRSDGGSSATLIADLGSATAIDTVALMRLNLTTAGTIRVRLSNSDPTGATGEIYDSGSLVGKVDQAFGYLVHLLGAAATGRYLRIDLSEPGASYIEAGRIFIGSRYSFGVNFDFGWTYGWVDPSKPTKSTAGQTFIDVKRPYRVFELTFGFMSESDRRGFVEQIDRINGRHTDVLFITDPADSNLGFASIWGLLTDLPGITQPHFDCFAKPYRIEERL